MKLRFRPNQSKFLANFFIQLPVNEQFSKQLAHALRLFQNVNFVIKDILAGNEFYFLLKLKDLVPKE